MTKLGGWWMSTYHLDDDEELVVKYPTNYFCGNRRPHGGRLYLTDSRGIFVPHRLDSLFGAKAKPIPYDTITEVGIETKADRSDDASSAMPERLRIKTTDGKTHLFIVDRLERAHERMRNAMEHRYPDRDEE